MTRLANFVVCWMPRAGCALLAASLTSAVLLSSSALAQTIDYGSLEQLFGESVTTSATGTPQRATEVPANMEIVTAEEIRRSGAYDIPGVLRHVLGVDVLQWFNDNADVGLRGYNQAFSPRVLVLIDGRQVYADHYGYTPWSALPVELSAIRQIEVVKGPTTALFGFNAVSGVINIITYGLLYDDVNTASISGGTQGLVQGSIVKTIRLSDKGSLRLTAGGRTDNDFSTTIPPALGALTQAPNHRFAFDADAIVRLSDRVQLSLEATHSGSATNDMDASYSFSQIQHVTSSLKGQLSADTGIGLVQATIYSNWTSQELFGRAMLEFKDRVTVVQLQDMFRVGADHTFRASLEYRHNEADTTPFAGGRIYYDVYSAAGMWNWAITPAVSLTNAVRLDQVELGRSGVVPLNYPFINSDWDRSLRQWSMNSGLVWKVAEQDTVRFLVGRGIQLPNLATLGQILLLTPFYNTTGVPTLDPTVVWNYEVNWDRALPALDGKFRAAVFHQQTDHLVAITGGVYPAPNSTFFVAPANAGGSTATGLELSLTGKFAQDWRWGANYRFESITDHFDAFAQGGLTYIDFENVTPRHVVKANLGWSRGRWEIDTYFYYQTATQGLAATATGSMLTPIGAYVSADARVAYRVTEWATLSVSGQNLLQSPQKQTSGPAVERRVFATITVNF